LLLALLSCAPALAQAPAKGMFLVAAPEMSDPRFAETVLLLLHYGSEGAIGIAVNRPTWVEPLNVFPDLDYLTDYRGHVYFGGPVARANVLVLVKGLETEMPDAEPVVDDIYVSADRQFLRDVIDDIRDDTTLRLYAGHANWGAGQLDQEIAGGSWRVVPASGDNVFTDDPLGLWQKLSTPESEMMVEARDVAPLDASNRTPSPAY